MRAGRSGCRRARRTSGRHSRHWTAPLRRPCSPTVRRLRSTRSTSRLTATIRAGSRRTAFALDSTRPMSWRAPSGSTWSRPGGDRPSTTISAVSPSPAFWRPFEKRKAMSSAQLIDHLKKADMAKEAERLLDGSGWLPEPLRLVDVAPAPAEQDGEAGRVARIPRR